MHAAGSRILQSQQHPWMLLALHPFAARDGCCMAAAGSASFCCTRWLLVAVDEEVLAHTLVDLFAHTLVDLLAHILVKRC
jgi:hypothetical protein